MATRSLNKALLIGNLTREPEIRYTSSGAAVCSFGVATNRSWKDSEGEIREEAEFHNIVAWNKMAEVCYQILAKGMKVYIEGEIRSRSWEDESGTTKYRTEIKVNEMILLDSRGRTGAGGGEPAREKDSGDGDEEVTAKDIEKGSADSDDEKPKKKASAKKTSQKEAEKESDGVGDPLEDDLPF